MYNMGNELKLFFHRLIDIRDILSDIAHESKDARLMNLSAALNDLIKNDEEEDEDC